MTEKKEVIIMPGVEDHPYSSAVRAGEYIFLSGQIGSVDDRGNDVKGIQAQTKQCLENMKQVLEAAGASLGDVVKVNVFLVNVDDFPKMNEVYQSYFPKDRPARSTIVTRLVIPELLIEVECIAYKPIMPPGAAA